MSFTKREIMSIRRIQRTISSLCPALRIYVVDRDIIICKAGVPARELQEIVGAVHDTGVMLTDLHDASKIGNYGGG